MSFSNPVPVAVAVVPYKNKLIGIRRGIEPRKGQIAFPGGYINSGEPFSRLSPGNFLRRLVLKFLKTHGRFSISATHYNQIEF